LENLTVQRTYSCTITFDRADDGYDCAAPERMGTMVEVYSLGISSLFCADATLGNIGTDDPANDLMQECTFNCTTIIP
jgi:hypothetical protein